MENNFLSYSILILIWDLIAIFTIGINQNEFSSENMYWQEQVHHYWRLMNVSKTEVRNIMDMNAFVGGFAVSLNADPVWVMNVVPSTSKNTLSAIYDRGLVGVFHDW